MAALTQRIYKTADDIGSIDDLDRFLDKDYKFESEGDTESETGSEGDADEENSDEKPKSSRLRSALFPRKEDISAGRCPFRYVSSIYSRSTAAEFSFFADYSVSALVSTRHSSPAPRMSGSVSSK
jgi:hypothetical protein